MRKLFIIVFITFFTPYSEHIVVNVPSFQRQRTNKNITIVLYFPLGLHLSIFRCRLFLRFVGNPPFEKESFDFMGESDVFFLFMGYNKADRVSFSSSKSVFLCENKGAPVG